MQIATLWNMLNEYYQKFSLILVFQMKQIGHDGYNPTSVAEWLDSIELGDYTKSFLINGYTSMDLVKKIWEIELINVSWLIYSSGCSKIRYSTCLYVGKEKHISKLHYKYSQQVLLMITAFMFLPRLTVPFASICIFIVFSMIFNHGICLQDAEWHFKVYFLYVLTYRVPNNSSSHKHTGFFSTRFG